jgi:cephalosporin hydroxylase
MNKIKYTDIITSNDLIRNALINDEFIGFTEDYLIIHCLISEWKPKRIFEIGTNTGRGCLIMKNASPDSEIITLDIRKCGEMCPQGVVKIVGDSLNYDFSIHYPIDCWFIDGDHTYENANKETLQAIKADSKYIIYHDADLDGVYNGIMDAFGSNPEYDLYQVTNPPYIYSSTGKDVTRIAYAIKK